MKSDKQKNVFFLICNIFSIILKNKINILFLPWQLMLLLIDFRLLGVSIGFGLLINVLFLNIPGEAFSFSLNISSAGIFKLLPAKLILGVFISANDKFSDSYQKS